MAPDCSMPSTRSSLFRERQRDPAGADGELEDRPVAGELGEELRLSPASSPRASSSYRAATSGRSFAMDQSPARRSLSLPMLTIDGWS